MPLCFLLTHKHKIIMKALKLLTVFALISSIAFVSCKKESDDSGDPSTGNGTMSLKYGGTSWNATLDVQCIKSGKTYVITGTDSNTKQAQVQLSEITTTGTYEVTMGSGHTLRWTESISPTDSFMANGMLGSGTITINELTDTKIVGTFSFTGFSAGGTTRIITDGKFNVEF